MAMEFMSKPLIVIVNTLIVIVNTRADCNLSQSGHRFHVNALIVIVNTLSI